MKSLKFTVSVCVLAALYSAPALAWGSMADNIYAAAKRGDARQLNAYMSRGYSVDTPERNGETALCKAAADRNMRAYNLLLQYGANPYASCMRGTGAKSAGISTTGYVIGGAVIVGAGVAVAAAAGGGGGGGGGSSSSGSSSTPSGGNSGGNNSGGGSGSSGGDSGNNNGGGSSSTEIGEETVIGGTPGSGYDKGGTFIGEETVIGTGGSGGNNDNPGGNNDNPGGNNDNPGGNNDNPGGNNDNPGGNNDNPGGNNDNPGGNNDNPGGNNDNPGGNNDNPGGNNDNPGGNNDNPGGNNDNPGGNNDDPGGNNDNPGGNNDNPGGNNDNPGGSSTQVGDEIPVPTPSGNVAALYPTSYYTFSNEYMGKNFGNGTTRKSVNYLGAINAAQAYSFFIGTDANGNFATNLQNVTVGVVDSGVWTTHSELKNADGSSKVSGYNYDYGPCRNDDTTNCWTITKHWLYGKRLILYGSTSGWSSDDIIYDSNITDAEETAFNEWASYYDADYDWNERKTDITPNKYVEDNTDAMHGTHVAGLIAANMDGSGMMGVAFANAEIKAVKWDFQSTLSTPIKYLVASGAKIINLSMGMVNTTDDYNASHLSAASQLGSGFRDGMKAVIAQNTVKSNGKIDGIIVVKAAGNESVDNPDLQSGIKRLNETFSYNDSTYNYKDLQMLVVAAADVDVDASGKLTNYSLSSFSNQCGVTKKYCITAPGGDAIGSTAKGIYSTGEWGSSYKYYATVGTSQATPIVSGSLAFLKGAFPYMSAEELIELVMETANKTAVADYSEEKYGAGLIDLGAAVVTYIPRQDTMGTATFGGNTTQSAVVNLSGASLVLPAALQEAVANALPASIVTFDRYNRPFEMATSSFIRQTHGGYKTLKNDVNNIALPQKMQTYKNGNLSFSFAENMAGTNGGFGYFNAEYKNGRHQSGFYFSRNTAYYSPSNAARELKNPFMAFNEAYGLHHEYSLSKKTGFYVEAAGGQNGLYDGDRDFNDATFTRQAYALETGLKLHKSKNYALTLSSGMLYEQKALLGANGEGAFAPNGGNTYMAGVQAMWKPAEKITLSGSYYRGYTAAQTFGSDLLRTSKIESSSFAFEGDYEMDKATHIGLRFSSPLRVEKGRLQIDFPSGRDNFSDTVYRQAYAAGLKPSKREYKLAAYWNKELSEKLSLRTESGVRFNPEHQSGANDYRVLLGLSWTFN